MDEYVFRLISEWSQLYITKWHLDISTAYMKGKGGGGASARTFKKVLLGKSGILEIRNFLAIQKTVDLKGILNTLKVFFLSILCSVNCVCYA